MNEIKLLAVGDIFLQTKNNKHPFEVVKEVFRDKDILFGNLETVLSNSGKEVEKAFSFHTSPDKVIYLKDAGFDILNIANNHTMDLGVEGFNETMEVLNRNDLLFMGAGNQKFEQSWAIIERKNIRIALLGYHTDGFKNPEEGIFMNRIEEKEIINDIKSIRSVCDTIVVSLHWGIEKVFYPSPQQIEIAHKLIDSGATVILGHHPHVIQGIERYGHGLIAYSLGNFQLEFNPKECQGERNKRTNQSIVLSLKIGKDGLESYDIIPVKLDEDFIPHIVGKGEKMEMLHFISKISQPIVKKQMNETRWFEEIAEEYLSWNMKVRIIEIKKYGIKHFLRAIMWFIHPFVIRCCIGFLTRKLKGRDI